MGSSCVRKVRDEKGGYKVVGLGFFYGTECCVELLTVGQATTLSRATGSRLAPITFGPALALLHVSCHSGTCLLIEGYETGNHTLTGIWGAGSRVGINTLLAICG